MSSIKKVEVKVFMEHLFCDCGGVMEPTGECLLSYYPTQYLHKCKDCGTVERRMKRAYPILSYEPINKPIGKFEDSKEN